MFAPTTQSDGTALVAGDVYVRLASAGSGLDVDLNVYNTASGLFTAVQAPSYASDDLASVAFTSIGDVYAKYNTTASTNDFGYFNLRRHTGATTSILTTGVLPSVSSITGDIIIEG